MKKKKKIIIITLLMALLSILLITIGSNIYKHKIIKSINEPNPSMAIML